MTLFTGIEWATHTVNFWIGCTPQSAECSDCYALKHDRRFNGLKYWGRHRPRLEVKGGPAELRKANRMAPVSGPRPIVFINSMSDFFDIDVDPDRRARAWDVIRECDRVVIIILTKQAQNIPGMLPDDWGNGWNHVWLGFSAGTKKLFHQQASHLFNVPAAKYIWSAEPVMELINATQFLISGPFFFDWVMIGGRSKTHHPTHLEGLAVLVDQCRAGGVPAFVKQLGQNPAYECKPWPISDPKGGNYDEFPEWLKCRQFPAGAHA